MIRGTVRGHIKIIAMNRMVCPEKIMVRSTMIRDKLKAGLSVSELTTPLVNDYLAIHFSGE